MYEMKPEYFTGIDFIDKEHARLFEIANEIYEFMINEFLPDKYDYIIKAVQDLKDYTEYHFGHEEEYMESIGYKRIFSQKVAHADFIEKLNEFNSDTIDENQKGSILELLEFLTTWLIEHIFRRDKLIAE